MGKTHSFTGKPLDPNKIAIPCGALAKTLFNGISYLSIQILSNSLILESIGSQINLSLSTISQSPGKSILKISGILPTLINNGLICKTPISKFGLDQLQQMSSAKYMVSLKMDLKKAITK